MRDCLTVFAFVAVASMLLAGCGHLEPRVAIGEPVRTMPAPMPVTVINNGAIYQEGRPMRPLFEDNRPRHVGDILTVAIQERTAASRSSRSSSERASDVKAEVPLVRGFPGKSFQGAALGANSGNKFEGKGETANENQFNGTITVSVVQVLPNGNLVVAGDKQIGINHNIEIIRFSGIVRPDTVQSGDVVASSAIADARLEYRGRGYIDEAQRMGWLQRFFLSVLPL